MKHLLTLIALFVGLPVSGEEPFSRCEVMPMANQEVSLQIDGIERCRWHFGERYPRPFFFPLRGPSGASLTRMGHPGAQNHDHHRSVWFAHARVEGIDFWSDHTDARIRQKMWLAYEDSETEAIMAGLLGWYDGENRERMEQEYAVSLSPDGSGGSLLEFQLTLRPPKKAESVTLEKTNFGVLAVRVARSISHHFGGGNLTSSEGLEWEEAIFGKSARWMDYSGPVPSGTGKDRKPVTEGITYFDHPGNPNHPVKWHVRSDGWMGASLCMDEGITIASGHPLVLRYLLHAHGGGCDRDRAEKIFAAFAGRSPFIVRKSDRPHRQYEVFRLTPDGD